MVTSPRAIGLRERKGIEVEVKAKTTVSVISIIERVITI